MRHPIHLDDLVIASSGTTSNIMALSATTKNLVDIIIYAPAALTGTVSVYLGYNGSGDINDCSKLYVGGSAITIPAGGCVQVPVGCFFQIAVVSSGAEAQSRTFKVVSQVEMD